MQAKMFLKICEGISCYSFYVKEFDVTVYKKHFPRIKPGLYFSRRQSPGSATDADNRACVYTSAGDCRQHRWATVVSSRRL